MQHQLTKQDIQKMEDIIFRETTTIGIRRMEIERSILEREIPTVQTKIGVAKVKVCETAEGRRYYPEYESVAAISRERNIPFNEVYQEIQNELKTISTIVTKRDV